MKHHLVAFAALALGLGVSAASAQTVVIEPEQETIIREYITTAPPPAPLDPAIDFDVTVGSIVPETVEVYELQAPEIETPYEYVVIENRTVLVEPETRRIVHIIE